MGVHNLANATEFKSALAGNNVVVLDAFATWCGPCKAIAPKVSKLSEEYPTAHFVKIDVDEVPDVAQELGIRAMPTFLIFKGEEKIAEVVGANPVALEEAIKKAVAVDCLLEDCDEDFGGWSNACDEKSDWTAGGGAWFMTFKMIDESMVFKYLLVSSCFVAVDCCDRSFALTLNMHYFPFTCLVLNTWEVSLPVKEYFEF
ncbi:hypothetical protein EYC84_000296 [Monilinia fructicola]|uniref:Thioredoxin domain-containing protein n=1 Tax=Monilinia fructicola TaxID=38448 RepID=A0A5M9JN46_MONFR|nr:hypothetical protein EYC84_000296 [Monilinia fructicola]